MTDLPISISNTPAKAATNKPSGNDNAAAQDAQGFSNVLARQVEDSAKPAEPPTSSGDAAKQPAEHDKVDAVAADIAGSAPVDMLAALLAQQNPIAMPQAVVSPQPVLGAQIVAGTSVTADKKGDPSLALISAEGHPSDTATIPTTALDTERPKADISAKDSKEFAETFKALDKKELSSLAGNLPLRGNGMGDLITAAQQPALPALLHGITAPSGTISASISAAVTQPAWGDEFCQKITWIATQHNQSAELHLNPPQLGPLDVVLKINGDQASATFTSPHAAVRDAIELALPKLREMLADNGIMLGNAMVNDQAPKNGQDSASQKPQRGAATSASEGATDSARIQEARVSSISRHNGMVDTFA